jgi:1-acyl-sn-glycerol-3-phosphate acyltransferase
MFYWVVKAVLAPILRVLFRPWAQGAEYVPRTGPAILASNHLSFSDHFFAPLPLPRKVVFLAKSEYFTGRGIKGLFSKAFFSGVGQIPVDRSGGEASERALATGLRVLASGQLLGIYPEGTRTPDGRLFRGKTGVARLALEARVPVIPCAMIGGFEFQPPGRITPHFKIRPGVKFGKPLDFSRYYGLEGDGLVLRAVTDEIIYEIMKLSGQEYVDEYAAQHKAKKHAEKRAHKHDAAAKGGSGRVEGAVAEGAVGEGAALPEGAALAGDTSAAGAEDSAADTPGSRTAEAVSSPDFVNGSATNGGMGSALTGAEGTNAGVAGVQASGSTSDVASTSADADRADPESDETPAAAKASDASSAG